MENIRVVIKKVGEKPKIEEVKNHLESFQEIVGGYIGVYPLTENILIVLNEEGDLLDLDPNYLIERRTGELKLIVGNVAIVSEKGGNFGGLSDRQLDLLKVIGMI